MVASEEEGRVPKKSMVLRTTMIGLLKGFFHYFLGSGRQTRVEVWLSSEIARGLMGRYMSVWYDGNNEISINFNKFQ